MIAVDVLGPWHRVEVTDSETGETRIEALRLPQFLADVGAMPWRDVTAQLAEAIPPTPGLAVWRVWCDDAQLATLVDLPQYEVLRSAEVTGQHADPAAWPVQAAAAGEGNSAFPPLPASGWLEAGAIYAYGGEAVMVRQGHNRTEHAPADVPALFMVYRPDAPGTLEWIAGEQVQVGTVRTYEGVTYSALQAHVTEATWTPPATPALWAVVATEPEEPTTSAWAVGVAYAVGDVVTYAGVTYTCRQAHTSIASWTPPAVLALWLPV